MRYQSKLKKWGMWGEKSRGNSGRWGPPLGVRTRGVNLVFKVGAEEKQHSVPKWWGSREASSQVPRGLIPAEAVSPARHGQNKLIWACCALRVQGFLSSLTFCARWEWKSGPISHLLSVTPSQGVRLHAVLFRTQKSRKRQATDCQKVNILCDT